MDLETECSVLESVEDNETISAENLGNVEETKIENNGACAVRHFHKLLPDNKDRSTRVNSLPTGDKLKTSPSPATRKGHGLKKWRRIRREINKDWSINADGSKLLNRGLSNLGANLTKPQQLSVEMNEKSGISVSSMDAAIRSPGFNPDGLFQLGDSGLVVGPAFAVGTDSENSEDRNSKSSTAASAPKLGYQIPSMVGHASDKNRIRSLNLKTLGNPVRRGQQGKGRTETFKKARGERVKVEKENSHSSLESDSQSSNFAFTLGMNSATSNSRHRGMTVNNNGEDNGEAQGCESQFFYGLQAGYGIKDAGEFKVVSQENLGADLSWKVEEERSENHVSLTDQNPLAESFLELQSAQEALEQELEKLRDIGKEDKLVSEDGILHSDFIPDIAMVEEPSSSDEFQFGASQLSSSHSLETHVISLRQNVKLLQSRFEETRAVLKMKEVKVIDLEAKLDGSNSAKEEEETATLLQLDKCKEMVGELEGLFREKIEAEVEYLAISRTIQRLRVAKEDQSIVLEEQAVSASDQTQKVGMIEVLRLQNTVAKYTFCFIIQLILLVLILGSFILQLSPHYAEEVPT